MLWMSPYKLGRDVVLQRVVPGFYREVQKSAVTLLVVAVTVDGRLEQALVLERRYLELVRDLLRRLIYHHVAFSRHARGSLEVL